MAPQLQGASKLNKGAAPAPKAAVSLDPTTFAQGGGLIDDADVTVTDIVFCMWDYNGSQPEGPALAVEFTDSEGKKHEQYYSAGKAEYFVPSEDGGALIPVADRTSLHASTNAGLLIASMVSSGVPVELLTTGNIKDLVGLQGHVNRVPQPKRRPEDKEREVCLFTKLIALPGEQGKAQSKGAAPKPGLGGKATQQVNGKAGATPASASAPSAGATDVDEELANETVSAIIEVLGGAEGPVTLKALAAKVFAVRKSHPRKAEIMKLSVDKGFLETAGDGVFTFDGSSVSIAS